MRKFIQSLDHDHKRIAQAVLAWSVFIFVIALCAHRVFPNSNLWITMASAFKGKMAYVTPLFRWDSIHYLRIVNMGYENAYEGLVAFLPGYSLLIRIASWPLFALTQDRLLASVVTGLGMNVLLLILTMIGVKKLYEHDFKSAGLKAALLMLVVPYAFYYLTFYTETLFLFLTVTSFWAAITRRWFLAAVLAGLASGTRLQGTILLPALLVEYLHQKKWKPRQIRPDILWLVLCPAGLIAYLIHIGGIHVYLEAASAWQQRVLNWNVFYPLWVYFTQLILEGKFNFSDTVSVLSILIALFLLIYGWKKLRPSYLVFILLCMAMPMITTVVQAVGRYYMVIFPFYFLAAHFLEKRPNYLFAAILVSGVISGILIAMYTNGFWVA